MNAIALLENPESIVKMVKSLFFLKVIYFCLILAEKLSDVSLSGKRSYLALKGVHLENSKFNIELQLRPLTDRGLILYVGHGENSFLSLTLHSGMLEFRVLPGNVYKNYMNIKK